MGGNYVVLVTVNDNDFSVFCKKLSTTIAMNLCLKLCAFQQLLVVKLATYKGR